MKKSKKTNTIKKIFSIVPIDERTEKTYYIIADSGFDRDLEYIFTSVEVESGILYSMFRSDSSAWSKELRGETLFQVINTGDGYHWINNHYDHLPKDYSSFYELTTFLRIIQELESRNFDTSVMEVKEVINFKF